MALVFRELEKAIKIVENRLLGYPENDPSGLRSLEEERLVLLTDMERFMLDLNWLKADSIKDKIRSLLKTGFDYKGVADSFGVKVGSLKASVSRASRILWEKFGGEDIFQRILDADLPNLRSESVRFRMSIGRLNPSSLLLTDVRSKLPDGGSKEIYSLLDCGKELEVLKTLTYNNLDRVFARLSTDKLAFIASILDSSRPSMEYQRELVYRFFSGDYSWDDLVMFIQEDARYSSLVISQSEDVKSD